MSDGLNHTPTVKTIRLWINLKSQERFLEAHAEARKEGGIEPRNKATSLGRTVRLGRADFPQRPRGQSGQVPQTVRKGHADRPAGSHGPSVKGNKTTRTDPRKMDHPRRPGGPSARVPDCPLLKLGPSANRLQRKPKTKPHQIETKREHEEHHDELCPRGSSATTSRTVRPTQTDPETARPRGSTPPTHHRISQTVETVETRVWGHDKRQTRMLYPKNFAS
jgi:hypothetical protein